MAKIETFEDLEIWKKSIDLYVEVYSVCEKGSLKTDFGAKDQLRRAVLSISNNIAEGFDRSSNADFKRFIYISLASCSEVKSMLILAKRLGYLNDKTSKTLILQSEEISKIINGFIKSLK
jgi:hypothetical protein